AVTVARWMFDLSIVRCIWSVASRGGDEVVDQPGASDAGCDGDQDRGVDLLDRGEGVGVDELEILGLDLIAHELAACGGRGDPAVALAGGDQRGGMAQRPRQSGRAGALCVAEVRVAARQREPAALANGRTDFDRRRNVEIAHETLDHERLLSVLLTEEGDLRPDDVEQLGHDRGDTVEVLGPAPRALERLAEPADDDAGRESLRGDLRARGREQQIDAGAPLELGVARLVARIGREVLTTGELRRVDKQRHHDGRAPPSRVPQQREMTVVQRAHRRDQADRPGRVAEGLAGLGHRAQRPHAPAPKLAVAAASASKTPSRSGARAASAARWRATVALSPRAIGPSATRKFDAMLAAAWYSARSSSASLNGSSPARAASPPAMASARGLEPAIAAPAPISCCGPDSAVRLISGCSEKRSTCGASTSSDSAPEQCPTTGPGVSSAASGASAASGTARITT